jgi:hypothetical protein
MFGPTRNAERKGPNCPTIRSANWPWPTTGWGLFPSTGTIVFLAFGYGVRYVLLFATIIAAFATAIALAVLLVMVAWRSIWRLFR